MQQLHRDGDGFNTIADANEVTAIDNTITDNTNRSNTIEQRSSITSKGKFLKSSFQKDKVIQRKVRNYPTIGTDQHPQGTIQTSIAQNSAKFKEDPRHGTVESGGQIIDSNIDDDYSPDEEENEVFDNAERFGATTEFQRRIDHVLALKNIDQQTKYKMIAEISAQMAPQNNDFQTRQRSVQGTSVPQEGSKSSKSKKGKKPIFFQDQDVQKINERNEQVNLRKSQMNDDMLTSSQPRQGVQKRGKSKRKAGNVSPEVQQITKDKQNKGKKQKSDLTKSNNKAPQNAKRMKSPEPAPVKQGKVPHFMQKKQHETAVKASKMSETPTNARNRPQAQSQLTRSVPKNTSVMSPRNKNDPSLKTAKDDSKLNDTYTPGRIRASKIKRIQNSDDENLDAIDIRIENKSQGGRNQRQTKTSMQVKTKKEPVGLSQQFDGSRDRGINHQIKNIDSAGSKIGSGTQGIKSSINQVLSHDDSNPPYQDQGQPIYRSKHNQSSGSRVLTGKIGASGNVMVPTESIHDEISEVLPKVRRKRSSNVNSQLRSSQRLSENRRPTIPKVDSVQQQLVNDNPYSKSGASLGASVNAVSDNNYRKFLPKDSINRIGGTTENSGYILPQEQNLMNKSGGPSNWKGAVMPHASQEMQINTNGIGSRRFSDQHRSAVQSRKFTDIGGSNSRSNSKSPSNKGSSKPFTRSQKSGIHGASQISKIYGSRISQGTGISQDKSPAKKLMEDLTDLEGRIDDNTSVIINGQEVLSKDGIGGKIRETGVGFGTGRHTSGRRGELPVIVYEVKRKDQPTPKPQPIVVQSQRLMIDAACSASAMPGRDAGIDVMSQEAAPLMASVGASACNFQLQNEVASCGNSAMPEFSKEVRSAAGQVSTGRFDPRQFESAIQTDRYLLDLYLAKNTTVGNIQTDPIEFAMVASMHSAMMQTDQLPSEDNIQEPLPQEFPAEPMPYNEEQRNSKGDLMEEHVPKTEFESIDLPQPQEPYDDTQDKMNAKDWSRTKIFNFIHSIHMVALVEIGCIKLKQGEKIPEIHSKYQGKNLNQQIETLINPKDREILTEMECDYIKALLSKRSQTMLQNDNLAQVSDRAKTTIECLSAVMIKSDLSNYVLFKRYAEANRKNVIKLLLRAKLLYDAQKSVISIFKHIVELEEIMKPKGALWRILQDDSEEQPDEEQQSILNRTLELLGRVLTLLAIFQAEHKVFDGEFSFRRSDYRKSLRDWGLVIGGFLYKKGLKNPSLLLSGLLLEDHQETDDQVAMHTQWFGKSIELTGKLEFNQGKSSLVMKVIEHVMTKQTSFKSKAGRVAEKISMLPPIRQATPVKKRHRPETIEKLELDEEEWDIDNDQHRARAKSNIRVREQKNLTPMYKSPYVETYPPMLPYYKEMQLKDQEMMAQLVEAMKMKVQSPHAGVILEPITSPKSQITQETGSKDKELKKDVTRDSLLSNHSRATPLNQTPHQASFIDKQNSLYSEEKQFEQNNNLSKNLDVAITNFKASDQPTSQAQANSPLRLSKQNQSSNDGCRESEMIGQVERMDSRSNRREERHMASMHMQNGATGLDMQDSYDYASAQYVNQQDSLNGDQNSMSKLPAQVLVLPVANLHKQSEATMVHMHNASTFLSASNGQMLASQSVRSEFTVPQDADRNINSGNREQVDITSNGLQLSPRMENDDYGHPIKMASDASQTQLDKEQEFANNKGSIILSRQNINVSFDDQDD